MTGAQTVLQPLLKIGLKSTSGNHFSVAMRNDYTLVGWGDNASGQVTVPAAANQNLQSIACGPSRTVALPYTPVLSYPVDMRRDFLIIYNTSLPGSGTMLADYQTKRRSANLAPSLGIALDTSNVEVMSGNLYAGLFYSAVVGWYTANPTMRPAYILLMYGIPNTTSTGYVGMTQGGSLQNDLRETLGVNYNRRPFISALNSPPPQQNLWVGGGVGNFPSV